MNDKERLAERVLVIRCQIGDRTAFERLVRQYQGRLGYFVRRMIASDEQIEDILQEVWLTVFRKIGMLANAADFRSWLYGIARNKTYKAIAGQNHWLSLDDEIELTATDPGEHTFAPEDAAKIHGCLVRIAPQHREVLVLRFLEDMSYEEIALVTRSNVGTVRSRLHYAKRSLRQVMEDTSHDHKEDIGS